MVLDNEQVSDTVETNRTHDADISLKKCTAKWEKHL